MDTGKWKKELSSCGLQRAWLIMDLTTELITCGVLSPFYWWYAWLSHLSFTRAGNDFINTFWGKSSMFIWNYESKSISFFIFICLLVGSFVITIEDLFIIIMSFITMVLKNLFKWGNVYNVLVEKVRFQNYTHVCVELCKIHILLGEHLRLVPWNVSSVLTQINSNNNSLQVWTFLHRQELGLSFWKCPTPCLCHMYLRSFDFCLSYLLPQ